MFRVLAQPRWLVGLLLALVGIGGFVSLGLWQLDRHDQQQIRNSRLSAAEAFIGLPSEPEAYQPVEVSGTWLEESTVEVVPRYRDGVLGATVVSVLLTEAGRHVAVERGWTESVGLLPAPSREYVVVEGRLIESQGSNSSELADRRFARLDIGSIEEVAGVELFPYIVVAEAVDPVDNRLSNDLALSQSTTPHFGYALQWFGLAAVVLVGFPLLVRKAAR